MKLKRVSDLTVGEINAIYVHFPDWVMQNCPNYVQYAFHSHGKLDLFHMEEMFEKYPGKVAKDISSILHGVPREFKKENRIKLLRDFSSLFPNDDYQVLFIEDPFLTFRINPNWTLLHHFAWVATNFPNEAYSYSKSKMIEVRQDWVKAHAPEFYENVRKQQRIANDTDGDMIVPENILASVFVEEDL